MRLLQLLDEPSRGSWLELEQKRPGLAWLCCKRYNKVSCPAYLATWQSRPCIITSLRQHDVKIVKAKRPDNWDELWTDGVRAPNIKEPQGCCRQRVLAHAKD